MHEDILNKIGEVSHGYYTEICLQSSSIDYRGANINQNALSTVYCRVYRKCLNIESINSAKIFMKAKGQNRISVQKHTINRHKFIFFGNSFKPVKQDIVSRQVFHPTEAMEEESNILSFIHPDPWPLEFFSVRKNLHPSNMLDNELVANEES